MQYKPEFANPFERRHLWTLPCVAIKVFLKFGMRQETLRAMMRGEGDRAPNTPDGEEECILHTAHQVCHARNALSERIESQLNVRFRRQRKLLATSSNMGLVRHLAYSGLSEFELVGILWALQTDPSIWRQRLGEDLMRAFLYCSGRRQEPPEGKIIPWPRTASAQPSVLSAEFPFSGCNGPGLSTPN